ncbi:hypothetical protein EXIGLDRAFT_758444 [Exidia glandulosa HHB12029]|uniref:Uncharacterized protein n=1 Tax=Exidia glandulosa HHB12029 TaxID=1314781 RepID=A0A165QW01_EXIGL|nr:hypothetical protein EXIGLDRAFT_758444 [Exidia glandulosa HHB12029]
MSSLPFPTLRNESRADLTLTRDRSSWISTTRSSAVEVHDIVYGAADSDAPASVLDRLASSFDAGLQYENPMITASSREIISDIHFLTKQLAELDVPRPKAMLATLFGKRSEAGEPWFQASRVWSELGDICESESFDDNRISIIEHTIHIVLLPQLHTMATPGADPHPPPSPTLDVMSTASLPSSLFAAAQQPAQPVLSLAGGRVQLPSPLHFKLRVTTRLSFNEAGRITRHRDIWDVRDFIALAPGMGTVQAVTTRLAGFALSAAAWALGHETRSGDARPVRASLPDPASSKQARDANLLGLNGVPQEGA